MLALHNSVHSRSIRRRNPR